MDEYVDRLLHCIQRVAPRVFADLTSQAGSAKTDDDLMKTVVAWAVNWGLSPERLLAFYRLQFRKTFADCRLSDSSEVEPIVSVEIKISKRLMWSPEADPTASELMKAAKTATNEELRHQINTVVKPVVSSRQLILKPNVVRDSMWFVRYQILEESRSHISQTANKFLESDPGDHPANCDRGTVARGIERFAHQLGVVLRPPDRGGRPTGRKDCHPRHVSQKNL